MDMNNDTHSVARSRIPIPAREDAQNCPIMPNHAQPQRRITERTQNMGVSPVRKMGVSIRPDPAEPRPNPHTQSVDSNRLSYN
jgi:hypothetical protein